MNYVFIVIYCIWFLSEVFLNRMMRSGNADKKGADKGTLVFLWTVILAGNFSAVYVTNLVSLPIASGLIIPYAGLALIVVGVVLRLAIIATLGRFFTVDVTIREDHRLKTDGFYKYVRHPSYSASLLSFAGFGLSFNNWLSLLLAFVPVAIAFMIRITIEEKALIAHFGEAYRSYKKDTKALIPFIC